MEVFIFHHYDLSVLADQPGFVVRVTTYQVPTLAYLKSLFNHIRNVQNE